MGTEKIQRFTDLNAWKKGHELTLSIYKLVRKFPKREGFILVNQMLRAAISVTSNLAEGFGRRGLKDKIQFYVMAQASLVELQNQLFIARDVSYISKVEFEDTWSLSITVHKLIGGLITSLKKR